MARLGGANAQSALVKSIGPGAPTSLVPGAPRVEQSNGRPFLVRAVAGPLLAGAGVITCIHHTGNDGAPLDGQVLPAAPLILVDKASGVVIFYQTLNPGSVLPPLYLPFFDGLTCVVPSGAATPNGIVIAGYYGLA